MHTEKCGVALPWLSHNFVLDLHCSALGVVSLGALLFFIGLGSPAGKHSPGVRIDTGRNISSRIDVAQLRAEWAKVIDTRLAASFSKANKTDPGQLVEFRQGPDGAIFRQRDKSGVEVVIGCNSKYRFKLLRTGKDWSIEEVEMTEREGFPLSSGEARNTGASLESHGRLLAGIVTGVLREGTLVDATGQLNSTGDRLWCDQDEFEIVGQESALIGEVPVVHVSTRWIGRGAIPQADGTWSPTSYSHSGEFWCLPEHNLLPIRSEIRLAGATISRELTIDSEIESHFPIVGAEHFDWIPVQEGTDAVHTEWQYDTNFPQEFPATEFRLSAFGLPEPPGVVWRNRRLWVWVGMIGIGLIAVALITRKFRRPGNV